MPNRHSGIAPFKVRLDHHFDERGYVVWALQGEWPAWASLGPKTKLLERSRYECPVALYFR